MIGLRALLLALLCAGVALADGPRVRIRLKDGTELEGELVDFQARTYQVLLPSGARREVPEREVAGLSFPEAAAEQPAARVLARVLRAAAGNGVLAERLPATQAFQLREGGFAGDGPLESGRPRPRTVEALLRVRSALAGEELTLRLEAWGKEPGTELTSFGLGPLPAALEAKVGLDGGVRALRLVRPGAAHELALTRPALDALPELLAALLLAPLHDQGLPEQLRFGALTPRGGGSEPWTLLLLPADSLALARSLRIEPGPEAQAPALDLTVGLRGAERGRLLGWRGRSAAAGMRRDALEVSAERLAPEAWVERLASWKVEASVPEPPPAPAPSRLGELYAAAAAAGRIEPALGERWLRWEEPGRLVRAVRVVLKRDADGLRIEVAHQPLHRSDALVLVCLLGPRGLTWLRLSQPDRGQGRDLRGLFAADAEGALAGSARSLGWEEGQPGPVLPLPREAVPALLARFVLPLILPPGSTLELPCLEEASLASPLGLAIRPRTVGAEWPAGVSTAEQAPLLAEHEAEEERAKNGPQEAAARTQATLIAALRALSSAQTARVGAGRAPALTLEELGLEEPAGWQLLLRADPDGRWLALAWPLDQAVQNAGAWAVGSDGQIRRAHAGFKLPLDAAVPDGFSAWKR